MIFGATPLNDCVGAILAHGTRHKDGVFKKGRVLSVADVELLRAAGHATVITARLSADDVPEDDAARQVAQALTGANARAQEPFTGRANVYSSAHGLCVLDEPRLRALNHLHESLTIATLPGHAVVEPRQMLATVKVIPFAVPRAVLEKALAILAAGPLLRVAPFRPLQAALIMTRLPQTKPALLAKSEEAMRHRLERRGARLAHVETCDHAEDAVAGAIAAARARGFSPILVMGASAIVDRADVIPAAVEKAGGRVLHLGMPVDPGNLLMLAAHEGEPVIGVPSCARSVKLNGFDWVLDRVIAGIDLTREDIMDMGAGGLLAEIPSRPSPREGKAAIPAAPRVVAVVLAAGTSSRMRVNKLLQDFLGQPVLAATLARIRASSVDEVIVVTGRDAEQVAAIAEGARIVNNPQFADGISTSIRIGVQAAGQADAVLICLGDMPLVQPQTIDRLIAAFNPTEHRSIVAPLHYGQFGNPVLWGRDHFASLESLTGDKGGRALLSTLASEAVEIAVDDSGILADADTPDALARLREAAQSSTTSQKPRLPT